MFQPVCNIQLQTGSYTGCYTAAALNKLCCPVYLRLIPDIKPFPSSAATWPIKVSVAQLFTQLSGSFGVFSVDIVDTSAGNNQLPIPQTNPSVLLPDFSTNTLSVSKHHS